MKAELFCFLDSRCIDFATTKLITFAVLHFNDQIITLTNADCYKIRTFIRKQTNLKELIMQGEMSQVFDQPLLIQSQLKKYEFLKPSELFEEAQQNNLCDFIDSQLQLKHLDIDIKIEKILTTTKIKQLYERRLDMPLDEMTIYDFSRYRRKDYGIYMRSLDTFRIKELQRSAVGLPNLSTTKLHFFASLERIPLLVLLVTKFPNVRRINIDYLDSSGFESRNIDYLSSLNGLQHLKVLEIEGLPSNHLKNLNIRGLESFSFNTKCKNVSYNVDGLIEFLNRHRRIRKLEVTSYYDDTEEETLTFLEKILSFANGNLKELMTFSIINYICKDIDSLLQLITRPGFVLQQSLSLEASPSVFYNEYPTGWRSYTSKRWI